MLLVLENIPRGLFPVPLLLRREKLVQIEFIKFALRCDLANRIGHLVGHKHHLRQRRIGVFASALPICLGLLLVRIRPIENLLFYELARHHGAERRAGKEQVAGCRYRKRFLVHGIPGFLLRIFFQIVLSLFVLVEKELPRGVAPCAEVIFVEDDEIPVYFARPFMLRLYPACVVRPEKILERAKADDGALLVRRGVLLVERRLVRIFRPRHELPAVEIDMRIEILLPGRFHRRLECENEYSLKAHLFRKLVCRESLPEAHFCVPEKLRRLSRKPPRRVCEICGRLLYGLALLAPHRKIRGPRTREDSPVSRCYHGGADGPDIGMKPLALAAPHARASQNRKNFLVEKRRAV